MAHIEQQEFCKGIQKKFPEFFNEKFVLDIGSLDINGSNEEYFNNCTYIGVDISHGKNVDIVSKGHELDFSDNLFDVIISTECFEHDQFYDKTIKNIYRMLKPGGLFLFTCATLGRPEHGTRRTTPGDAPFLQNDIEWSDYYKNLTEVDIREVIEVEQCFSFFSFENNLISHDLYFYGFKKEDINNKSYDNIDKYKNLSLYVLKSIKSLNKLFESQRIEIEQKENYIQEQREKIESQRIEIEQKENYIQEQREKIESQRVVIEQKENYIQEQRGKF